MVGALGTIAGGLLALLIGKSMKEPRGMMIAVMFFGMLIERKQLAGVPVMLIGMAAGRVSF